jgi:site-specific recombinase XerD
VTELMAAVAAGGPGDRWPGVADPAGLLGAVADWLAGYGNLATRRTYAEGLGLPVTAAAMADWLVAVGADPEWAVALHSYAKVLDVDPRRPAAEPGHRPPPAPRGRLRHLHWFRWCAGTGLDPLAARAGDVKAWLAALADANAAVATRDRMLGTVKALYAHLAEHDLVGGNPAALNRRRLGLSTTGRTSSTITVTPDQVAALIAVAGRVRRRGNPQLALRAKAIVTVFTLGVRVSELCELDDTDRHVNRGRPALRVPGKGDKPRIVYLSTLADQALTAYLAARGSTPATPARRGDLAARRPLFTTRSGSRLSRQDVWHLLRRLASAAGLDLHIHPHVLRHFYVTTAVEAGADLADVQADVGHASIDTTRGVYDHSARDPMRSAVDRVAAAIEQARADLPGSAGGDSRVE